MKWTTLAILVVLSSPPVLRPERACVVPRQGYFRIHVGTSGLFGAFAHEHSIEAQNFTGCAVIDPDDVTRSSIKLEFSTAEVRVMDSKESAKDRAEIQGQTGEFPFLGYFKKREFTRPTPNFFPTTRRK